MGAGKYPAKSKDQNPAIKHRRRPLDERQTDTMAAARGGHDHLAAGLPRRPNHRRSQLYSLFPTFFLTPVDLIAKSDTRVQLVAVPDVAIRLHCYNHTFRQNLSLRFNRGQNLCTKFSGCFRKHIRVINLSPLTSHTLTSLLSSCQP